MRASRRSCGALRCGARSPAGTASRHAARSSPADRRRAGAWVAPHAGSPWRACPPLRPGWDRGSATRVDDGKTCNEITRRERVVPTPPRCQAVHALRAIVASTHCVGTDFVSSRPFATPLGAACPMKYSYRPIILRRNAAMAAQHYKDPSQPATLPFSAAVAAGDLVFVSGQVAKGDDGNIIPGDIEAHTRQTLRNV